MNRREKDELFSKLIALLNEHDCMPIKFTRCYVEDCELCNEIKKIGQTLNSHIIANPSKSIVPSKPIESSRAKRLDNMIDEIKKDAETMTVKDIAYKYDENYGYMSAYLSRNSIKARSKFKAVEDRRKKVANYAKKGMGNKEIAKILGVKNYVVNDDKIALRKRGEIE